MPEWPGQSYEKPQYAPSEDAPSRSRQRGGQLCLHSDTGHSRPGKLEVEIFGVSVKRNFHYYLHCLQSMQGHSPPKQTVARVYQNIQADYINNVKLIWSRAKAIAN